MPMAMLTSALKNQICNYIYNEGDEIYHNSTTCVEDSHGLDWMVINCTGLVMNYFDPAGTWVHNGIASDIHDATMLASSENFTYNEGTHMRMLNTPLTFGTVYSGTSSNANTNSGFAMENCGNVELKTTVLGVNVTDGGLNILDISNFKLGKNPIEVGLDIITLNGTTQDLPNAEISVSTGLPATTDLYSWVAVPIGQAKAVYNSGTWTFTAEKNS